MPTFCSSSSVRETLLAIPSSPAALLVPDHHHPFAFMFVEPLAISCWSEPASSRPLFSKLTTALFLGQKLTANLAIAASSFLFLIAIFIGLVPCHSCCEPSKPELPFIIESSLPTLLFPSSLALVSGHCCCKP